MTDQNRVSSDREILEAAHNKGTGATLFAFIRLSGPGWIQAAITLGGGSLASALYLGVLGKTSMLWLQLVAIVAGVIMLSAISYITLSTGKRPYRAMSDYVNPVLAVGWIVATILANMIWIMPQFSLCFDAIDLNLAGDAVQDNTVSKYAVSVILFMLAGLMVYLSSEKGWLTSIFDWFLKIVIAIIIFCFVGVVVILFRDNAVSFSEILSGCIPDFSQWNSPTKEIQDLLDTLTTDQQKMWHKEVVNRQRDIMISSAATAVGLNMTFLLPYTLLSRGWDRTFRGLSIFDLVTGMAIPFVLVTSCIIVASAHSFHAKADADLLSTDTEVVKKSMFFKSAAPIILDKVLKKDDQYAEELQEIYALEEKIADHKAALSKEWFDEEATAALAADSKKLKDETFKVVAKLAPSISKEEKTLATTLVKPNANQLAKSLVPLLGEQRANLVFGAGALAMGFSTIIILMMINGFAVRELFGVPNSQSVNMCGAVAAGIVGICYPIFWGGASKTWLVIMASSFGAMLLPIAYVAFFFMMNNPRLMGEHKPTGGRLVFWNILMLFGVITAFMQAISAISTKLGGEHGMFVLGAAVTFVILTLVGFSARRYGGSSDPETSDSTAS